MLFINKRESEKDIMEDIEMEFWILVGAAAKWAFFITILIMLGVVIML